MKAFAARGKDRLDIEGVLIRQAGRLDWAYVESQLQPLVELMEEREILERRRTCGGGTDRRRNPPLPLVGVKPAAVFSAPTARGGGP